ncbi:RAD55 family ATPase [Methanohalobium sp.]|uniref:RAD55 family ATPase n=1 Tax=Methanohalobium sp. TaxID=2837493 RepID=UPI0025D4ACD5|nr:RAD55 family ATPase [Methanohalobium sp.]
MEQNPPLEEQQVHSVPSIKQTGIFALDRILGGGLPAGSLTYISADPKSMSEVFLYQFTLARKTYYFTTNRKPLYVHQDIINQGFDASNVNFIDIYSEYYLTSSGEISDNIGNQYADTKIIEFTEYNLKNIINDAKNDDVNIIIDNFTFFMNLNVNISLLKRILHLLYESTKEIQSLTYLYGLKGSHSEDIENDIFNASDVIFDVHLEHSVDKVNNKLSVPKIRGMTPKTEIIKFNIAEGGIQIDTSKDIA